MFEMLKHMSPPLGLGKKCPARVAYKVDPNPTPRWLAVLGLDSCLLWGLSVRLSAALLSHCVCFLCPDQLHFLPKQRETDTIRCLCTGPLSPRAAPGRLRKMELEATTCLFSFPSLP